jgi:hypothetical protein
MWERRWRGNVEKAVDKETREGPLSGILMGRIYRKLEDRKGEAEETFSVA